MIRQLDVDGVPALLAPTTGPMHAGLVFRAGMADEPVHRRGITHMVEHLALHSAGVADYHYNGVTGVQHTYFHMQGSQDDVVAFLNGVCASLADLPVSRLATEKEILRTEAATKSPGAAGALALWRHGARDFGTVAYPEFGLHALTADDVREWAARYFTNGNAALWIAADEIPAGLKLALPGGDRQPLLTPSSALPEKPAYFQGGGPAVAWDAVVARTPAAPVFASILERTMMRTLRQEAGLSYEISTGYEPVGADRAMVSAYADALPEKSEAVLGGFVDILSALRAGGVDEEELAAVRTKGIEAIEQADQQATRLRGQAFNLLSGRPLLTSEEAAEQLRGVTSDEVTAVANEAWDDGLLMTPGKSIGDWAGFTAAPVDSATAVTGVPYRSLDDPLARIIVAPDGVSAVSSTDEISTVRYADCEALLTWPDGGRRLIGADAVQVAVEPTLYSGADGTIAGIDAAIPSERHITMPPRDPDRIPRPREQPVAEPPTARPTPEERRKLHAGLIVNAVAGTLLLALTLFVWLAYLHGDLGFHLIAHPGSLLLTTFFAWSTLKSTRDLRA
jgi:zinc protease